ncbi:MAG: phosphoribosylformylglycinamidine synthase subunit PurS [Chitinophagaceae bacterium]
MTFSAHINIMPLKELLDPQGKAVMGALGNLGVTEVSDVRIGKHILLQIEAPDREEAQKIAEHACSRLLANPVMESFEFFLS